MSLLIYLAQICVCVKVVRTQSKITMDIDIEDMFDDSRDEYSEEGYDSDEEENGGKLFLDNEDEP